MRSLSPAEAKSALDDGSVDAVISGGQLRSKEEADDQLVGIVQAATRQVRQAEALRQAGLSGAELQQALNPPALKVTTVEPVDPERDRKGGVRVRRRARALHAAADLRLPAGERGGGGEGLAGRRGPALDHPARRTCWGARSSGSGLLGFGQLVVLTGVGLLAATLSGALDVTGDVVGAAALAVGWFVLGYAFYAGLFACAGALVPRQEELQSTMTPLTMLILISFFVSFIVLDDPDGTLAHVTAYIPFSAPITMPPRIALGEAPAYEIVIALAVTTGRRSR